jgi:anti-sigma regulatory factor (Ser/Thr protein kinase)
VSHRVLHQTVEGTAQQGGVGRDRLGGGVDTDRHASIAMIGGTRLQQPDDIGGGVGRLPALGHLQQLGDQMIEAGDLGEDGFEGCAAPGVVAGQRVLGAQPHGGDRVADFMRHAGGNAAEGRQPLGEGDAGGQRVGDGVGLRQTRAGTIECRDQPVEFRLAGGGEMQFTGRVVRQGELDRGDPAAPGQHQPAQQRRHAKHQAEQHADAEPVATDAALLRRALDSLVQNAVRHTPDGGEVSLRAVPHGRSLRIEIADTGPGVPPPLRQTLFEPFVTGRPDGTGLGLAIARELVQSLGGTLSLLNSDTGAVFLIELAGDAVAWPPS